MTKKIRISFAVSALNDLEELIDYYKEQEIPHIGEKLVKKVIKDIEFLRNEPEIGRIVPEFGKNFLRELIRPPFRIVYRKDSNRIQIVRVWRSERLLSLKETDKS